MNDESQEQQARQASSGPVDAQQAEQARRQINQITEEIAQLAETDVAPQQFYAEFLQRLYFAVQGFAGAIWIRTPQGNLLLQCQINLREVGLDRAPESRPMHDELLRQAALHGKGGIMRPNFSHNFGDTPDQLAGNPTDFVILLVPVFQEKSVVGLIEIWQDPNRPVQALQNVYQFIVRLAAFVSVFNRNHQLRQMLGQQELWLKLETFTRQVHGSMNETEVAYLIANEGRRLIEVDRISVATKLGSKCAVTAISGADVVEKRSNLVVLMRKLFDAVMEWGEKLVYTGTKDDALPPKVLTALDLYLAESNSKILVILPLVDERDKEKKKKPRSALMMECFETNLQPEQLNARLDVVGRHAAPALYNALEYHRIPMRFLWLPLAYVQDGLGGKTKAITTAVVAGVVLLILAMITVPFPLKMEATGQALPKKRDWIYTPIPGKVDDIMPGLIPGSKVARGQTLLQMYDLDFGKQITELQTEIAILEGKINQQVRNQELGGDRPGVDPLSVMEAKITRQERIDRLENIRKRSNANLAKPGYFKIVAPRSGIILTADFRENLLGRYVKPSEQLLRIGFTDPYNPKLSDWEIELKIPQKHYGQVMNAYKLFGEDKPLDVDLLFQLKPTESYRAKLYKHKIAPQANPQKDDTNEPEPVVMAWASISDSDIPVDRQVLPSLLLSGGEVHARIRCGDRAMGYSLFYGVYEFMYEKVIFPYWYWK